MVLALKCSYTAHVNSLKFMLITDTPYKHRPVLPSLAKLHLSPKPVIITFVNFAVYGLTSIDSSTATSIVHSELDYCNCLYYKLPKSHLFRLQQIQNSLAGTVVQAPKSCLIIPIVRSLHSSSSSSSYKNL